MTEGLIFQTTKGLNESIEFYKKWNGVACGRITGAFGPMPYIPVPLNF